MKIQYRSLSKFLGTLLLFVSASSQALDTIADDLDIKGNIVTFGILSDDPRPLP